jgi:hypothetical protein
MTGTSKPDSTTYEVAKTHLKAAFEHSIAAGRDVWELTEFAFEKFGDSFGPYLHQFFRDVGEGRIKIHDLTESAKASLVGGHVTAEERESMIREAAYLRAEQRGFVNGSPEEDWLLAEQEVDERLMRQSGLIGKGRRALSSAATWTEQELASFEDMVTHWLEEKPPVASKSKTQRSSRKEVTAKHSTSENKKAAPVKKTAKKTGIARTKAVAKTSTPAKKEAASTEKITKSEKRTNRTTARSTSKKEDKNK